MFFNVFRRSLRLKYNMINSVNTLELLRPKLITMDKFNSTPTTTKLVPPPLSPSTLSQARTYFTFGSHLYNDKSTTNDINLQKQEQTNGEIYNQKERVKVQHLENHTKLQNNNCNNNFRTLCNNLSASSGIKSDGEHVTKYCEINTDNAIVDVIKIEPTEIVIPETPITNNIQSKSAFKLDLNNMKYHNNTIYINKNNNGLMRTEVNNYNTQFYLKQYHNNNYHLNNNNNKTPGTPNLIVKSEVITEPPQRTEDQNKAFRHIESVHNYAKLKSYKDDNNDDQSPYGSRLSSYLDDEEEDEDDDEDDNENEIDEEYNNGDIDYEQRLELSNEEYPDLDAAYEDIFNRNQKRRLQKLSTSSDGALFTRVSKVSNSKRTNDGVRQSIKFVNLHYMNAASHNKQINDDEEDTHIDVDVETVESQTPSISLAQSLNTTAHTTDYSNTIIKPDHHARRPMNAFLIFCKRHRAIVKERYKNLENRAITKILGDWWASLDSNDKKCFTNLAQQNKDAFFSANPNFKWYKLPAPPLRTLTTRPCNGIGQDYQEDKDINNIHETISNMKRSVSSINSNNNYFILADEAQMGDLSQLMQDKSKATNQKTVDLQQALSETSQFMSAHLTGNVEALVENNSKRRFYNDNSFSSNSSEEEYMEPKQKNARSCKGKRYQELINSGQIVTAIKKSKSSTRLSGSIEAAANNCEINVKHNFINLNNNDNNFTNNNICPKRSASESDNIISYELHGFDLEERIKELPALDLDEYLQRKRNVKKKKKISSNAKKRGQRSNSNNNSSQQQVTNATMHSTAKQYQQTKTAVGSQKRKARKESITRRDISIVEQEVAPLLPLTINGCCYFQEAPTAINYMKTLEKDTKTTKLPNINVSFNKTSSSIIPLQNPTKTQSSLASVDILTNNSNNDSNTLNDNISSSTSDLLILAEVAANRTELKH